MKMVIVTARRQANGTWLRRVMALRVILKHAYAKYTIIRES